MRYRYRNDDELKDSGVEWIGKIPKSYTIEPLKKYYSFEKGKNAGIYTAEYIGENQGEYPVYSGQTENEGIMGRIKSYEYNLKECLFTTTVGAKVMTVSYLTGKFTLSQNCLIMLNNRNDIYTKYIYYYLQELFRYEKSSIPSYMQPSLRIEDLKKYRIVTPNLNEQEKIANFLDEKTSQFDLIISKKEQLIERLEEAKKSLISEVVTGKVKVVKTDNGYELIKRSSEEMKDSGVEWLGQIPKDWEVSKIKYECDINARIGWKALKADEYVEEGYIFLATPNIKCKDIDYENVNYITKERYDESPEIKLKVDDVVLTKDGSTLGTVNVIRKLEREATVNSSIAVIRPFENLKGIYLNYFIKSNYMQSIIGMFKDGMGVPHLFQSDIKLFNILLPKIKEQKIISEYLDINIDLIENMKSKSILQIEKLKESKQSLISEAVTGKIEILD